MSPSVSGRTWEEASSPAAVRLARRFEAAWRDSTGPRPSPSDFLPDEAGACPGARLALLRAEIALRWEAGERVGAAWYLRHYPGLSDETLVALVYEEFCLREEGGEDPQPAEYLEQFPELAAPLRRVFDIHGLVGTASSTGSHPACASALPFPRVGQTIAGFRLVEELGRGAFARVFLAEERQLADRPVALKVARSGSREPQTLARLQHTHIVPVHSTRADQATGLHLLCMPYFGRVTLARILADPALRSARTGQDLIAVLDRLGPPGGPPSGRSTGRAALGRRTYAQAIAWWAARMAEALDHAHDRGVLHRDIKPSNVLVTGDGMPMLLDFNLARDPVPEDADAAVNPAKVGGTIDYMAPEHLEALAEGLGDRVDGRADIYGLGVLLYEALMGARPFEAPRGGASMAEALFRAADERRRAVPRLRATHPEVPAALEAIVARCLAPDPDGRYATAADLAADLQAVADDQPLRFAREPAASRTWRWVRRRQRSLLAAAAALVLFLCAAAALIAAEFNKRSLLAEVVRLIENGQRSEKRGDYAKAMVEFDWADRLATGVPTDQDELREKVRQQILRQPGEVLSLEELRRRAREYYNLAQDKKKAHDDYQAFLGAAEILRFRLIGFGGDLPSASRELKRVLGLFYVLDDNDDWTELDKLDRLEDVALRRRLIDEVNQLLFLWAVALERSGDRAAVDDALKICDRALIFAQPQDPWHALRARLETPRGRPARVADGPAHPSAETSDLACFQWGVLQELERDHLGAIAWLDRAVRLKSDYWYEYYLAYCEVVAAQSFDDRAGPDKAQALRDDALQHYAAALALRPRSPWVRFGRAQLERMRGHWAFAAEELRRALGDFRAHPDAASDLTFERKVGLELGLIDQSCGNLAAARREYQAVIVPGPRTGLGRAARLNRAKLDADTGLINRARAEYDALLAEDPQDVPARLGRALLALRIGRAGDAEADLTELIDGGRPADAELLAHRARARLALGRYAAAEDDAAAAFHADPSPSRERLWTQAVLVRGGGGDLRLDQPDEVALLPVQPAVLRAATDRLQPAANGSGDAALRARLARAVLLSALGDPAAEAEASRAVELAPLSGQVFLVRARVRRRAGARRAALADVERALALDPRDPRLYQLRGQIAVEAGDGRAALADLDRATYLGADGAIHTCRALALWALGGAAQAAGAWTRALQHDPEDPRAYLGRARAFIRLGKWDQALADLEQAAGWVGRNAGLSVRIALAYARCLPERPDRLGRVVHLARSAWLASLAALSARAS